ncbi:MAG TPA: DNA topoisomerase IB [Anaeromyxobacter sp.]|nr:DNA topoisomerase IB [Anaeromyxobacter sp.]
MRAIDRLLRRGIRRVGSARTGFRYVRPGGRRARRADAERIRQLALPPAWTEVHAAPEANARLQAIGRDRAGRWQYRYRAEFLRLRAAAKYRRLLRFADALPRIRAALRRDMGRRGLPRERVLAAMVRVLEACFMRPGSEAYARRNGSYGLTTVRRRHVRVARDLVEFDYRGKSGQRQVRELRDARVARLVRACLRVPGRDVFKFLEDGEVVDVRRRHLNAYLRGISGAPFTAKDFRTWAGTLLCAGELARRAAPAAARAERRRAASAALRAVADRLGNTPAVARSSYVSPAVLAGFGRGRVVGCALADGEVLGATPALCEAERELVALLRAAERRPALRALAGGGGGSPEAAAPTGATAKPARRAARRAER